MYFVQMSFYFFPFCPQFFLLNFLHTGVFLDILINHTTHSHLRNRGILNVFEMINEWLYLMLKLCMGSLIFAPQIRQNLQREIQWYNR